MMMSSGLFQFGHMYRKYTVYLKNSRFWKGQHTWSHRCLLRHMLQTFVVKTCEIELDVILCH